MMQYRTLPGTEEKLSVLGYGCMRLPTKSGGMMGAIDKDLALKQIRTAIDRGVNYLDTAWPYHRGLSESFLGDYVLKDGYREKVNVADKLPCFLINRKEKIREIFEKQKSKLKIDVIDYYLLHSLNGPMWDKMLSLDIIPFMDEIRKEGSVRKMGFSFHGKPEEFKRIVDGYDWDFCQVQYNILDENYQAGIDGINYAASQNMGVFIMEPLRGGSLVGKMPGPVQKIYDGASVKRSAAEWAFRWIYNHPQVTMVLSGMNRDDHIEENLRIAEEALPGCLSPEEEDILSRARETYLDLMQVGCTGCAYCMPCPAGIDIPAAFKQLNNFHMFGKTESRVFHMLYSGISTNDGKPHWTRSCLDCGKCENHCPQNIEIRKEFAKVRRDLEGPGVRLLASAARPFVNRRGSRP
ncbi:MAG: aldo/keto reductase [Spirochaetales bacterium]|nr:aldo/keto reductase [Spirochaetales bacterium]